MLKQAYETSINSAGSATKELETYLESIEGKFTTLKSTAQGLSSNLISEDWIKGVFDLGTGLLTVVDGLIGASKGVADWIQSLIDLGKTINPILPMLQGFSNAFETWKSVPTILATISAALAGMKRDVGLLTPVTAMWNNAQKKKNVYKLNIIPTLDEKEMEIFNSTVLNNPTKNQVYKDMLNTTDAAKKATSSLQEYYAQCVKLQTVATKSGYQEFMNERVFMQMGNKSGMDKVLKQYDKLYKLNKHFEQHWEKAYVKNETIQQNGTLEEKSASQKRYQKVESYYKKVSNDFNNYSTAIARADTKTIEYLRNTEGAAHSTKELTKYRRADKLATIGQTAANIALNAALSYGIGLLISGLISGIQAMATHKAKLRDAALEAADALKEENETLQEQSSKIETLKKSLDKGNLSEEEAYNARKELVDIQSELLDTYGKEAERIDLVNGELSDQLELLRNISAEKAKKYVIENDEAINNARKEITERKMNYFPSNVVQGIGTANLWQFLNSSKFSADKITKKIDEDYQEKLSSELQTYFDNFISENNLSSIDLFGDTATNASVKENLEMWQDMYDLIEQFGKDNHVDVSSALSVVSKQLNKLNEKYGENYRLLYDEAAPQEIANDTSLSEYYQQVTDAIEKYNEALASGKSTDEAIDNIQELRNQFDNGLITDQNEKSLNDEVTQFFNDIFEKYAVSINISKFKVSVEEMSDEEKKKISDAFSTMTDIDVKNMPNNTKATKDQKDAYEQLTELAKTYDISIESAVDAMVSLGLITEIAADNAERAKVEYKELAEALSEKQSGIESFTSAYSKILTGDSLTAEEVNKLVELYPQLIDSLQETADGYTVDLSALNNARSVYTATALEDEREEIGRLEADLANYNKQLKESQKNREEFTAKRNATHTKLNNSLASGEFSSGSIYEEGQLNIIEDAQNGIDNCIKKERELTEEIRRTQDELKKRKFLYQQTLSMQSVNWDETFKAVRESYTSMAGVKSNASAEMKTQGYLSTGTISEIIDSTDRWAECLTNVNGKMQFNAEKYQEIIEAESGYNTLVNESSLAVSEYNIALSNKEASLKVLAKAYGMAYDDSKSYLENLDYIRTAMIQVNGENSDAVNNLNNLENEWLSLTNSLDGCNSELAMFVALMGQVAEEDKVKEILSGFDKLASQKQHELNMGRITQAQYNAWYNSEWTKTKNQIGSEPLGENIDTFNSYEETNYSQMLESQRAVYEEEKLLLDNQLEDKLISHTKYAESVMALNEKYFGSGTMLGSTEDGKKEYQTNIRAMADLAKNNYDDLMSRVDKAMESNIIDDKLLSDIQAVFGNDVPAEVADAISDAVESGEITYEQSSVFSKYLSDAIMGDIPSLSDEAEEALSDAAKRMKSAFDEGVSDLDTQKDLGEINAEQYWREYEVLRVKYLSNDKRLTKDNEEAIKNIRINADKEVYEEATELLERQLRNGDISYKQYTDNLLANWRKYYKDKKGLEQQSDEALSGILDSTKEGANQEIEALEHEKELIAEKYENEISAIEDAQEAVDKHYDDEIEALEEKLKLIEEAEEANEKALEIEEKRNSLLEAQRNLHKSLRMVYVGNGQWAAKPTQDSLDALNEAREALSEAQETSEKEKLEKQIEKLQEEKDAYDKDVGTQIEALNKELEELQKPFDDLIKVLTYIAAEQVNSDPEMLKQLLTSDAGQEALETVNKSNADNDDVYNKQTAKAETADIKKKETDAVTVDGAVKMSSEMAEGNKTTKEQLKELGYNLDETAEKSTDEIVNAAQSTNTTSAADTKENPDVDTTPAPDTKPTGQTFVPLTDYAQQNSNVPSYIADIATMVGQFSEAVQTLSGLVNNASIGSSSTVINNTNNINSPVFNTEIHVTANGGANEIAQTIADTVETKITQAFISYGSTYRKRLDQISNGR